MQLDINQFFQLPVPSAHLPSPSVSIPEFREKRSMGWLRSILPGRINLDTSASIAAVHNTGTSRYLLLARFGVKYGWLTVGAAAGVVCLQIAYLASKRRDEFYCRWLIDCRGASPIPSLSFIFDKFISFTPDC